MGCRSLGTSPRAIIIQPGAALGLRCRLLGCHLLAHPLYCADAYAVGTALLWTLEQGLGLDFTPDVREAWVTAYGFLSSAVIAASSEFLRGAA